MSQKKKSVNCLVGAHTSAAGGAHRALFEGAEIGATTVQLFTSNQKRWAGKNITKSDIEAWQSALKETGMQQVMSHDSYLINLGSPNKEGLSKSKAAFRTELERCHALDLSFLNFHPGAALTGTEEQCLDTVINSLLELEDLAASGNTRLLIETAAGQGTSVGGAFEHIGYIVSAVKERIPIGVCIDTCHVFVAGYDIRTNADWQKTLDAFDTHVGLQHLYAMHLNDSVQAHGSRSDRHAPLGKGKIGLDCFHFVMTDARLSHIPKYLETPGGPLLWKEEIAMLRRFAHEAHENLPNSRRSDRS